MTMAVVVVVVVVFVVRIIKRARRLQRVEVSVNAGMCVAVHTSTVTMDEGSHSSNAIARLTPSS